MSELKGRTVAILATDGYEDSELRSPKEALEKAGAKTVVVSLKSGEINGWKGKDWHGTMKVDTTVGEASASQFDALVLPGGVINPDLLRVNEDAVAFVQDFFKQKKPVAAICHGPWMLAEAGVLEGRKVTSYKSIRTDLKNAGAHWVDEEVVVDNGLVTSRSPNDLPAFNAKLIEAVREGKHAEQIA
ncbi:MAG: type 1 glutamine amidotransferase [Flavobacteriales bacterium]|nr:type 1 glutamine amidotransferase [Flavobacteriales bacterium]